MKTLFLFLILLFLQPILIFGEWDEYCTSKARQLYRYSEDAESAKSELESAKSELESACSPSYGYQKDDDCTNGGTNYTY